MSNTARPVHTQRSRTARPVQPPRPTLADAAALNARGDALTRIRTRLRGALRSGNAYVVREEVINILADMGSGSIFEAPVDQNADTIPCPAGPDFEPDSAPAVPLTRPSGGA